MYIYIFSMKRKGNRIIYIIISNNIQLDIFSTYNLVKKKTFIGFRFPLREKIKQGRMLCYQTTIIFYNKQIWQTTFVTIFFFSLVSIV